MPWGVTNMELDPPEDCRGTSRRNFLKTSAGVAGDPGGVFGFPLGLVTSISDDFGGGQGYA